MPPKRGRSKAVTKAGTKTGKKRGAPAAATGPKTKAQRTANINTQLRQAIAEVKSKAVTKRNFTPDKKLEAIFGANKVSVYDEYSCTLNQTNIGQNNNKFYLIQVAKVVRKINPYIAYTRWGRVGEDGQFNCEEFSDVDKAIKAFRSKFKSKTSNDWDNRFSFAAVPKKYTLLEMAEEDEEDGDDEPISPRNSLVPKCKLDYRTEIMIKLIFCDDMFNTTMRGMNLDLKKMPLGKLSKVQIVKGLECLLEIEKAIKGKQGHTKLMELSSKFYTTVPHDFGRCPPQAMSTQAIIDQKKENMMTLIDIEIAQSLQDKKATGKINEIDVNYGKLMCELEWMPKSDKEFKMIQKYLGAAKSSPQSYHNTRHNILDIWRVNREGEADRMSIHGGLQHRKLLWHGTNIAVIAAILKAGLRIMPHSGGRVGRGIYFASEFTKSQGYMRSFYGDYENEKNVGFMLLVEVALGNTKEITDGSCSSATVAPKGYNSIVARGQMEPDEKDNLIKKFDKHDVIVPYGTPKNQPKFKNSGYWQSEYLVYKESQAQIRYLIKLSNA